MTKTTESAATTIFNTHGILAVRVEGPETFHFAKDEVTRIANATMERSLAILKDLSEDHIRLVVGGNTKSITIASMKINENLVAVALSTGHPISKSLRRMMTRAFAAPKKPASIAA